EITVRFLGETGLAMAVRAAINSTGPEAKPRAPALYRPDRCPVVPAADERPLQCLRRIPGRCVAGSPVWFAIWLRHWRACAHRCPLCENSAGSRMRRDPLLRSQECRMTEQALLLVNLGSPASTKVADVRSYLNQFLMDPYVIDLPWPIRRL